MTYLKVNRVIVYKKDKIVYDETFHHKINIIRGENGSGKSTIANFIYYGLGGDFVDWLPEAKSCDYVFIEVDINGKTLTLRREIVDKIMQPMQIFFGSVTDSLKSNITGWQNYGYKKAGFKESFSQVLFRALNFPEVTTENNESITINQILRALYIDQISPLDALMKDIDFDSPLLRQAVGYLLIGIYDDTLFREQIDLRTKKRELGELEREFSAIRDVYKDSNQTIDLNKIDKEITDAEDQSRKIDEILKKREFVTKSATNIKVLTTIKELRILLEKTSKEISDNLGNMNKLEAEIVDSKEFIEELKRQNTALEESSKTREFFGELVLTYCPSCLSKLETIDDDNKCHLCKQEINIEDHKSRILRIQQELITQIRESEYLINQKEKILKEVNNNLLFLRKRFISESNNLNSFIDRTNSSVDRNFDELLIKKGELKNQILNLLSQKKMIGSFLNVRNRVNKLKNQIQDLEEVVKNKEDAQKRKTAIAAERIQYYALKLLKGDGNYETTFQNASRILADFYKNTYAVDERNNFSASSLVILKNSIRFGIFFASLELDFMRYPRFILCDNIEDKGMREERSHNFQKNVVDIASAFRNEFQIIFTTSMIDTSLEIPDYTVGEHYTPTNKSLKNL